MMAMRVPAATGCWWREAVHPEYREVLRTYAQHQGMPVAEFGYHGNRAASTWRISKEGGPRDGAR